MTPDLLTSVAAATVVLLVPGYLWARALVSSSSSLDRAVMAVAVSMALVPATALALARASGSGVTFPVAVTAVAVVTSAGAMAYWRLRRAGRDEPRERVAPADLTGWRAAGAAAVGLLLLAYMGGLLQGRLALGIIVLASIAAVLLPGLLGRSPPPGAGTPDRVAPGAADAPADAKPEAVYPAAPRGPDGSRRPLAERLHGASWRPLVLPAVLVLVLVRAYAAPVLHGWPQRGGPDQYMHAVMTALVIDRGSAASFSVYPPGFHALTAVLSQLSGLDALELYRALAPALLVLIAAASAVTARWLLGPRYALATAAVVGLLLGPPVEYIHNSSYVAVVALTLLELTAVAFVMLLTAARARTAAMFVVLLASVVLYHTITTFELALVGIAAFPLVVGAVVSLDRGARRLVVGAMALAVLVAATAAWFIYDVPATVAALLGSETATATGTAVENVVGTQRPVPLYGLARIVEEPIVVLGVLGLTSLALMGRALLRPSAFPVALVLLWAVVVFLAGRTSLSAFPFRFARDLSLPLGFAAAFTVTSLASPIGDLLVRVRSSLRRSEETPGRYPGRPPLQRAVVAVAVIATVSALMFDAVQSMRAAARPGVVILTEEWAAAGKWLRERNRGGTILTDPWINVAILAASRYTGLPYERQTTHATTRDVRDNGLGSLARDVRRMRERPADPEILALLRRYDVRYVVLMKRVPRPRPEIYGFFDEPLRWRQFAAHPELYRKRYETENAIIFEVAANR